MTPREILKWISDRLYLPVNQFFDPCLYRVNWKDGYDYNALETNWESPLNFVNPPFSHIPAFFAKCLIEYERGISSVILCTYSSLKTDLGRTLISALGRVEFPGPIRFLGNDDPLNTQLCCIFLLTPKMWKEVEYRRKRRNKYIYRERKNKAKEQVIKRDIERAQEDIALRLLDQNIPQEDIKHRIGISTTKLGKIKKQRLNKYREKQERKMKIFMIIASADL